MCFSRLLQMLKSPKSNLPLKIRFFLFMISSATDASLRDDGTINRRLISFFDLHASPNPKPVHGVRTIDLSVDPSRNLWIRLFLPDYRSIQRFPLVVFFHGGGFALGSADSVGYDLTCRRIARSIPAVVASVNYRLAPEHRCPAPYEDGFDVLTFIDSGGIDGIAGDIIDPSSSFLAGDSAGGNIAHHVARRWAAAGGAWKHIRLLGMVLIQPYFGGEERMESEIRLEGAPLVSTKRTDWFWRAFLPPGSDRNHEAANVFGSRTAQELEEGFPPTMVIVGGLDPLQDWQLRYYEGLRVRGKRVRLLEYPDAVHAFYIFPEIAEGDRLMEEMGTFIKGLC